ncbi:MAG TPA: glycosyltransferase family 2 protein, partial [Methanothrix sp.]|nr:glycosyltransferase family 2 protein [Methanothrix sp.]
MGKISVVVVNFNGKRFLDDCLSSLSVQTYKDYEVIVVDNASRDGSVEHIRSRFPWARIVENKVNLGSTGGNNSGIREAEGEFIVTLNNDTSVEKDFLERLAGPMSDPGIGMCGSKMLYPNGKINSTGLCLSRSGASWDRGASEEDLGQYDRQEEIFGACAGAALYRRKMLDEIGLFDEDFFIFMEDIDLTLRARCAGWRCIYVPEAIAHHLHGATAGVGSDLTVYYGNRNIMWLPAKNYPLPFLITCLPWILGRNLMALAYYTLPLPFRVVLKAKWDGLLGLPEMMAKRK